LAWILTFDGQVYREADLTIDEAERIEELAQTTWRRIHPINSAKHARCILQTFLVTREGKSADEAAKTVGALKVSDFLDLLSTEEDDADLPTQYEEGFPPPADATSTPT
jgi:hypothetical protein